MSMDATWGLSWSQRWHKIDPVDEGRKDPRALCGAWLYRQTVIVEGKHPSHLLRVVNGDAEAPVCKRCQKAVERAGG